MVTSFGILNYKTLRIVCQKVHMSFSFHVHEYEILQSLQTFKVNFIFFLDKINCRSTIHSKRSLFVKKRALFPIKMAIYQISHSLRQVLPRLRVKFAEILWKECLIKGHHRI